MKPQYKLKLVLLFATLMFAAKPFVGFVVLNRLHPPVKVNIFLLEKSFSKRIIQYRDGSLTLMTAIQKKLAHPVVNLRLRFSFLPFLLYPLLFGARKDITYHFIRLLNLKKVLSQPIYLFNRQLIV
ncbi:hypothetical protein SAMN05192574_1098 [Mucilaginibacter gossypiicola]|uniref:Uncharacterized protein n=1 Tax=Mucilaginibacter gossypiicola TaxID=551995 RepID=A0A1H8QHY2_9SPHI|nr:hypothetical protein SAMN05192574_1098 [Mucilaginibacter gossypiicola]